MLTGKMESGLQYAAKSSNGKVGYCSLSVRCGTRAEGDLPEGVAHFVEHTLFKGTAHHSAAQINSRLDRLGGELNAYTTKEEIVLHATVLKEDIWTAVSLLLEIGSQATFPHHEIETERGVVLDEIISYKDCPADDIFDTFESRFFAGSSLGRLTLGTEESVASITREDLVAYYKRNFVPGNMVLSVVAPMEEEALVKKSTALAAKYFPLGAIISADKDDAAGVASIFDDIEDRDNHEANAIIGAVAPSLYEEKERITAVLLSNILGGPASNSLLNAVLREKNGWVYGIECVYTQYRDTGLFTISLGCDKENLKKCLRACDRIISGLKASPMKPSRLAAAKRQMLGQLAISSEGGENQCLSMGRSMLAFGRIAPDEESRAIIDSITPDDLCSMANRIFADDKVSILVFI